MRLTIKIISVSAVFCAFVAALFFLWIHTIQAKNAVSADEIAWGVDFSESQAVYLGLDPKETFSAIINDLGARNIKIHINWNSIEKNKGEFNFESLDSQVEEARRNNVQLILVIGMKTGRWPECHTPEWFEAIPEDQREAELLRYIRAVVERYKNNTAVQYWQIENEPLLKFGTCPLWYYKEGIALLQKEVDAVKALDSTRQIIISDTGELSSWIEVAKIADVVGVTIYRSSWNPTQRTFGINPYSFLSPDFYAAKAAYIQQTFGKEVVSIELQAEPWASRPLMEASLAEQEKSMNPQMFDENIAFARETNLKAFYFWGVEWWYWMKVRHDKPEIWDKARLVFRD